MKIDKKSTDRIVAEDEVEEFREELIRLKQSRLNEADGYDVLKTLTNRTISATEDFSELSG